MIDDISGDGRSAAGAQIDGKRRQLENLAWLLDSFIRLPGGFRIGFDALIGLVPFFGDAVGVLLSTYIVAQAARLGAPRSVLVRMVWNVAVEGIIGLLPIVGDVFDAAWRANQRNVELLGKFLDEPKKAASDSRRFIGVVFLALMFLTASVALLSVAVLGFLVKLFGL